MVQNGWQHTLDMAALSPAKFREIAADGGWTDTTDDICYGYAQANLVAVPEANALEFMLFCFHNQRACPMLDVTEPGSPHPLMVAPQADLRHDLPQYRIWKDGQVVAEPVDATVYWRDDLVSFLLGCSQTFEQSLKAAGVQFRRLGCFTSTIQCTPVGSFKGGIAVSGRLFQGMQDVMRAIQISSRLPSAHGAPLHIGDPRTIGIEDMSKPDLVAYPKAVIAEADETALWWACGITPQTVARAARLPYMITHYPGKMFITDRLSEQFAVL